MLSPLLQPEAPNLAWGFVEHSSLAPSPASPCLHHCLVCPPCSVMFCNEQLSAWCIVLPGSRLHAPKEVLGPH